MNPSRNDMPDKPSIAATGSELTLYSLLDSSDDFVKGLLIRMIRESGVKFSSPASFENHGWPGGPAPKLAKFWTVEGTAVVPSRDPFILGSPGTTAPRPSFGLLLCVAVSPL